MAESETRLKPKYLNLPSNLNSMFGLDKIRIVTTLNTFILRRVFFYIRRYKLNDTNMKV